MILSVIYSTFMQELPFKNDEGISYWYPLALVEHTLTCNKNLSPCQDHHFHQREVSLENLFL